MFNGGVFLTCREEYKTTVNEDVFTMENGDFPMSCDRFPGCKFQNLLLGGWDPSGWFSGDWI